MTGIIICSLIMIFIVELFVHVGGTPTCCPDDYLAFRGSCYHFGHNPYNFVESEHYCQQHGGHLVHIDDALENDYIKGHLAFMQTHIWWIGLTDELVEGQFMWRDDDPFVTYSDWDIGQPDGGLEDCVAFFKPHQSYKWHDGSCDDRSFYPICESRPTERPTIIGK